jgi:hypothetical protein
VPVGRGAVAELPSPFQPQAQILPSVSSARLETAFSPAEILAIGGRPGTGAGVLRPVVVPSPSCP